MDATLHIIPAAGYYSVHQIETTKSSNDIAYAGDPNKKERDPFIRGEIVAVGEPLITDEGTVLPPDYKVGDIVWYAFSGFEEIIKEGKSAYLIRFRSVIAKEEDGK